MALSLDPNSSDRSLAKPKAVSANLSLKTLDGDVDGGKVATGVAMIEEGPVVGRTVAATVGVGVGAGASVGVGVAAGITTVGGGKGAVAVNVPEHAATNIAVKVNIGSSDGRQIADLSKQRPRHLFNCFLPNLGYLDFKLSSALLRGQSCREYCLTIPVPEGDSFT